MDGCRTLCLLSLVLSACGADTSADTGGLTGFYVASSSPEQGATDVLPNQAPEFFLSGTADPAACNESQFILAGIDESGEYAFDVDFGVQYFLKNKSQKILNFQTSPETKISAQEGPKGSKMET